MLLCLMPIVGIGALILFKLQVNTFVLPSLLALCPLSHILMMRSTQRHVGKALSQETHANREE